MRAMFQLGMRVFGCVAPEGKKRKHGAAGPRVSRVHLLRAVQHSVERRAPAPRDLTNSHTAKIHPRPLRIPPRRLRRLPVNKQVGVSSSSPRRRLEFEGLKRYSKYLGG